MDGVTDNNCITQMISDNIITAQKLGQIVD